MNVKCCLQTRTVYVLDPGKIHLHKCSSRTVTYRTSECFVELRAIWKILLSWNLLILSSLVKNLKTFICVNTTTSFFPHSFLGEDRMGEYIEADSLLLKGPWHTHLLIYVLPEKTRHLDNSPWKNAAFTTYVVLSIKVFKKITDLAVLRMSWYL